MNKPYGEALGQTGEEDPFKPIGEQDDPFAPVDSQPREDLDTPEPAQQDDPFAPQDVGPSSEEEADPFAPQAADPFESVEMETSQYRGIGEPEIEDPFAPQEAVPYEASLPEPEIQVPTQAEQDFDEEANLSANSILGYGAAAAQQIGSLFGTSKEASGAVLLDKMKKENDAMLAQGWDRSKDFKAFDAELRKRTQAIIGGMIEEGTRIEAMGGPDAFLQGRANMGKRKTAKQKAVKDFDVNLLSRSLGSGFLQTGAGLVDAGATVANLAGMDSVEKYLTEKGKAMLDVQGFIPFEVNGVEDVSNIMDVGALIAKATGEMAPQVALSYLAGGGLLAGASRVPGLGRIAAGSPIITRSVGGFFSNAALETGGIAREQLETIGEINPKFAIGGGALAAGFETIADTLMFKNLWKMLKVPEREMLLKELATKTLKQIALTVAADAGRQGVAEFATESIQEMINYLSSDLAKKDPDFIKFLNNPDFNSQYWGEITSRVLDAGVQGAAGGVGLTSTLGVGTKAYYTNKARRIYGEMKAAEQELKSNLETLRKAADAAEASGSPQTAAALREQGRQGVQNIINRRYDAQGLPEMMASADQKTTETEQKEQAGDAPQATQKLAEQAQDQTGDQDLANFEETGDTFDSEEAAASYINTLPDKQNYQIVDNSDVDPTTGDILPEFMLIKRKVSVAPNEEQKPAEVSQAASEAAVATATTAEQEEPKTEAVAPVQTAEPEPAQESPEVVAPALEIQENKQIDEGSGVEMTKGKMTDPETGAEASYTIIPPIGSSKGSILLSSLKTPEKNRQKGGASKLIEKLKEKSKELDAPIKLTDTTKGTDVGFYFKRGFRKSFDILRTPVESRTKELKDKYEREYGGSTIYEPRDENIVADKNAKQEKSPGHIGFYEYEGSTYELYKGANGDLFRAPVSNVFDANTGYRIGRWEAPARMADEQAAKILGEQPAKIVEQEANALESAAQKAINASRISGDILGMDRANQGVQQAKEVAYNAKRKASSPETPITKAVQVWEAAGEETTYEEPEFVSEKLDFAVSGGYDKTKNQIKLTTEPTEFRALAGDGALTPRDVVFHELGHWVLFNKAGKDLVKRLFEWADSTDRAKILDSRYGGKEGYAYPKNKFNKRDELISDTYAIWKSGGNVPTEVISMLEELDALIPQTLKDKGLQFADTHASKISKAESTPAPKAELSDDLKTLVRLPEKDFMEVVGKYIAQDLPESRAAAFDLLLERYLKASVEGKGLTQATEEMLEAITAAMEANGENQERVERWKVQRSTDGLAEGVFSVNGLGTFDKPGKGWNAYAPNVKGVPDYQNKIYNEAIAQWSKIILDINAGVRGRTKIEAEAGKKTPPVIGDSKSAWVEYGKNLASVIARNAVSRVAEANRTSRMLSYDAMENPQFSEDDAMKYNDDGEVNEVSEEAVPGDEEIDTQEAMAENDKRSQKINLIKEELDRVRNESNDPLVKAVYDYHLGKLGMPNESGFDQSTTYDEVGESVIDKVKQPNGKPYSYASIGTMARQKGPEVEKKILEALKKYNDQVDESAYRDIIRPEAAKKDRRTASRSARGLRELKASIFARIGALRNKDLISNFQKTELLDLVPNDLTEELADQFKAELDAAAEQEDLDSDLLIQNIRERIQNYDAQKYTNDQGVVTADDQRPEVDVREQADLSAQAATPGPSETNSVTRTDTAEVSGGAPDVQVGGTEPGSGAGAEAVVEELPADDGSVEDEAAGKVWQATLTRAIKATELGIIDNNALDIIKEGLTRIISSPNSDFDETINALSDYLDAAENKALQDELESQGAAGALGEGSSRGSERPQRSEPRVQGPSDKDSSKKDRQGIRENAGEQKAVSGGDKGQERAEAPEKRDGERGQVDNGPRPGLATSFEKLIPTPKKEYVKLGDFGLDENQAKAVNLMVQAFEEGKKAFILGDGTGMGKTLTYMVAGQLIAQIKKSPVLLVALNDLWIEQRFKADLKRFGLSPEAFFVRTYTQVRDGKVPLEFFPAVIFDEAHTLKNESSKTSEMAGKLQGGFKIFATATPLDEVKQAAYFLSELTGESEDQVLTSLGFEVSYDADPNVPGGLRRRLTSKENKRDTDRALSELAAQAVRNGQYVRRYYPFWGKIKRVEVKLTEDQAKDYQKQIRYWDRQESMAQNPGLVRGQKTQGLKRWTETIKGKYILENSLKWLEENPTGKIVVMTDTAASQKIKGLKGSKAEVQGVAGFLYDAFTAKGYKAVKIFGNKNQKDTFGPLKQFQTQDPSVRVAISTIASGGTGIDLDDQFGDRPRLVWFAGTNFAASKVEQAMGRTSRRNTKSPSELRIVVAPESYGDTRAEEIKNQKMLNLRAIQGQAIEEEETSEGGRLTADNATLRPVTKYYEDAELSEIEGAQVDTRIEEQTPEVQNTVREFAKVAGANFPGVKIVFAESGKNTAWADPATLTFDTIYINPELLHEQFKDVVTAAPETSRAAMEFIADEEMSHNNYFKSVYNEALELGIDPAEYLNEELNKIVSGLTEGIKETVRQVYENKGGGKIMSNGHLVMEYMRMLDQLLRKGATTELKLSQDPNIPKVFQQFLPRSSVPMEGQSALYRLFDSLIKFFRALLDRKGMSPIAKKAVEERLEKLGKLFAETSNPILGSFGNRPVYDSRNPNRGVPSSNLPVSTKEIESNETLKTMHAKFKEPSNGVWQKTRQWLANIVEDAPSQAFDYYAPVRAKEEELIRAMREIDPSTAIPPDYFGMDLLPAEQSAFKMMRLAEDAWQTTDYSLHKGIPIWRAGYVSIKEGSRGLFEIFGQLGNPRDADLFRLYMVAKRAQELQGMGKDSNFSEKEIEEGMKLGETKSSKGVSFAKIFSEYREYQDGVLQFAIDSGLVSDELATKLREMHKNYVPYYRVLENADTSPGALPEKLSGPFSKKQVAGQRSGVKRFVGGKDPIGDLYENILKNISHLVEASVRNTAMLRLERVNKDLEDLTGQNFWSAVSPGIIVNASVKDFLKYLRGAEGINISDSDVTSSAFAKVFGMAGRRDLDPERSGIISFMRKGKPVYRKIEEGNRRLLQALTMSDSAWGGWNSSLFVRIAAQFRTLFQKSITMGGEFMVRNLFRDMASSATLNKGYSIPLLNTLKGITYMRTYADQLDQIRGQGAGNPSSFSSGRRVSGIYEALPQLKQRSIVVKTVRSFGSALMILDKIGEKTEAIHRTAITIDEVKRSNLSPAEAAWVYKQSNTDFSAHGANKFIRLLSATVPFFNAGLQSLYRVWGSYSSGTKITNDMSPTKAMLEKVKPKANDLMFKGALLMALALLYAALRKGDDRYDDLTDYEKDNFWIFFVGDTKLRIPKPYEIGTIFFTIPEIIATSFLRGELPDRNRILSNFGSVFRGTVPGLPQMISPVVQTAINYDVFRGSKIIPQSLENIAPSLQFKENTPSILTEGVARLPGVKDTPYIGSPLVQQKLVEGYFGTMGQYMLLLSSEAFNEIRQKDKGTPVEKNWQEYPVLKSFFAKSATKEDYTYPTYPTKYGKQFYEIANTIVQAENSIRDAKKMTDEDRQQEYFDQYLKTSALSGAFTKYRDAINELESAMRNLRVSESEGSPSEKKIQIEEMQRQKNEILKNAVKLYREYEKEK